MINNTGTWVVIPNLNGADYISECIDSVINQVTENNVIVVDNGSTDTSIEILRNYQKITLIEKPLNTGFSGGVNTGIEHALKNGADRVALLNNDAVADSSWVIELERAMIKDVGIVCSKIKLNKSNYLDSTGEVMTIWGMPFPRGRNQIDNSQYDDELDVFGASGGASMYRAEMLKEIGVFDDDFFAYLEDVDISFRAQAAGWKVRYQPQAVVYHKLSATSNSLGRNFAFFHFVKNYILLYNRNMPLKLYLKYLPLFLIHLARLGAGSILRGQITTFIKSIWTATKLLPATVRVRRRNLQLHKLSAQKLDAMLYHGLPPRPPKLQD